MNNIEKIRSMTGKELAHHNVRCFCYMNGYRSCTDFYTSDYAIFGTREEAEAYELEWLDKEVEEDG